MEALGKELICMMFKFLSNPGIFFLYWFCVSLMLQIFTVCVLAECCGEYRDG